SADVLRAAGRELPLEEARVGQQGIDAVDVTVELVRHLHAHAGTLLALGPCGEPPRDAAERAEEEPAHQGTAAGERGRERPAPHDPRAGPVRLEPDVGAVVAHRKAGQPGVRKMMRGVVRHDLLAAARLAEAEAADRTDAAGS